MSKKVRITFIRTQISEVPSLSHREQHKIKMVVFEGGKLKAVRYLDDLPPGIDLHTDYTNY